MQKFPSNRNRRAVRQPLNRRASVLILCVVLIVVLALIGTAMLSTARIDRYTSQQNASNTQIDLLVEGAKAIAKARITGDLVDTQTGRFRPPTDNAGTPPTFDYDHWDWPTIWNDDTALPAQNDQWLSSLIPRVATDPATGAVTSPVYWDAVTGPLVGEYFWDPAREVQLGMAVTENTRNFLVPTAFPDGRPAMRQLDPATGAVRAVPGADPATGLVTAADADGDGIADSLFCPLVPGELNGVKYYFGVRIVDNAAKLNVNTARTSAIDYDAIGNAVDALGTPDATASPLAENLGNFRSHVGLVELLNRDSFLTVGHRDPKSLAEIGEINRRRFNTSMVAFANAGSIAFDESTGMARADLMFINQGDAMEHQLARRLDNPAINSEADASGGAYKPYSISDAVALAYHGGLLNPGASRGDLENAFFNATSTPPNDKPDSLYRSAPNYSGLPRGGRASFDANEVGLWFDYLFNYDRATGALGAGQGSLTDGADFGVPANYLPYYRTLRPLLTTHNPVSNYIAAHDLQMAGDVGVPDPLRVDFDMQIGSNLMPDYSPPSAGVPARPVAKTDINTARFGELWRSFWNVMVDQTPDGAGGSLYQGPPFLLPAGSPTYENFTYRGNGFDNTTEAPVIGAADEHPMRMFRSSIRDMRATTYGIYLQPSQQMLLRAALAAVNAEDLRDSDDEITRRTITLGVTVDGVANRPAQVDVYGTEKQPYITEVYVNTDHVNPFIAGANPNGYVGIELYNPYPTPLEIGGWALAVLDRRPAIEAVPAPPPNLYPNAAAPAGRKGLSYFYIHGGAASTDAAGTVITGPSTFPPGTTIPAHSFLVLENFNEAGTVPGDPAAEATRARSRPYGSIPANSLYVPNLHWIMQDTAANGTTHKEYRGGELVLLRPANPAAEPLIENGNGVPVDSFDFTGVQSGARLAELEPAAPPQAMGWQYKRPSAPVGFANLPNWRFVYPGRYSAEHETERYQGTVGVIWEAGATDDPNAAGVTLGDPEPIGTYPTIHTIQIANTDFGGPNKWPLAPMNLYPFGGFMRNGDILQVPFIGAYRISFPGDPFADPPVPGDATSILELNSITIDSVFATDSDLMNDEMPTDTGVQSREQVGRFVPLRDVTAAGASNYNDFDPVGDFDADSAVTTNKWRYRWALDLFDYFTVSSPGNDYMPNVPTAETPYSAGGGRQPVDNDGDMVVGTVDNMPAGTIPGQEDHLPLHGLINVNTAPWKTMSALPMFPVGDNYTFAPPGSPGELPTWTASGGDGEEDNVTLARLIVEWRDGVPGGVANGPFRSIWELYRVPAFVAAQNALYAGATEPDDAHGDFSPMSIGAAPSPDGVRHDFEEQNLLLTRISNLITTRSDSYTVYLVIEGWRGGQVEVRRRAAFILDRSPYTKQNPQTNAYKVTND